MIPFVPPISDIELAIRIVLAVVLGGIIGTEREVHDKPAGLRTHVLICAGATLFTIISISFTGQYIDASRVAAGIVTGVGFLAAGAIFRAEKQIQGLTTAADIWVIAAIGVAIGIGYYSAALLSTILVFFVLMVGRILKEKRGKQDLG